MCKTGQSWVGNGQGLANNAISQFMGHGQANAAYLPVSAPEPTLVERGYLENLPPPVDPAVELARLITKHAVDNSLTNVFAGIATADKVRYLIRNHWSKVSALAHQIHDEGK